MEEMKEYKIGDLGIVVGGATPSTNDASNYDGDIAWITPKDLSTIQGRKISRGERMISEKGFTNSSCKLLPKGSVLFSSRAPIGYVAIAENELCTNQGFKSIIPNEKLVDSTYLYYLLVYNKANISALGSGTTFVEVSGTVMRNFVVRIPDVKIQKRIASILSSLDDKIELNRRINENLEQQAQALFKSWFLDFEPFKSGRFVESELGMIPEGWRVVSLGEVTTLEKERVGNRSNVKVLSPIATGELILSEEYFTKQVFSESISRYILVKPCFFAYNPARVNIGSIGRNTFDFDGCVSPVYVVFSCEDGYHYFFDMYRRLSSFKEEVITRSIGGVRQTLNYSDFALIKIVYPPKEIILEFNILFERLYQSQILYSQENRHLAELRDALLPKLMSGELKIDKVNR